MPASFDFAPLNRGHRAVGRALKRQALDGSHGCKDLLPLATTSSDTGLKLACGWLAVQPRFFGKADLTSVINWRNALYR